MVSLPIDPVLPRLQEALRAHTNAVVQAPPGAGKTTRVPLALLNESWLQGQRILLLEPRRLAARNAAQRMALELGEALGESVGYRIRNETRVGPLTRIEVITEGILTRMLQSDPMLTGVGAVIFDEFHERNLHSDLGLALCLDVQTGLREDLRLIVMSATLDTAAVAKVLRNAPIIASEGRSFAVETRYLERESATPEPAIIAKVVEAIANETGSILVFLPGVADIRRVEKRLNEVLNNPAVQIVPLYADLSWEMQQRAILAPLPAMRKVVLATTIAETSLTIEGIRIVIDSGLRRVPRFDPRSGMTRLETVKISQASAEQRQGRAGRLEPGICYRSWTKSTHATLTPQTAPEILESDLSGLALELANWGIPSPSSLAWLDDPPKAAFAQAQDLLLRLGAIDVQYRITPLGKEMSALAVHPRLAHMMLKAKALKLGGLACEIAALLDERDIIKLQDDKNADLRLRVEALRHIAREPSRHSYDGRAVDYGISQRVLKSTAQHCRQLNVKPGGDIDQTGLLLAFAYPDRIAQMRAGAIGHYRLANGRGAMLINNENLGTAEFIVAANLDDRAREARIFLGAPISRADIVTHLSDLLKTASVIQWSERDKAVLCRRQIQLGELILQDEVAANPDADCVLQELLKGIREQGLSVLPWAEATRHWLARLNFLRQFKLKFETQDLELPDMSDSALIATLENWLAPHISRLSRLSQLQSLDLHAILIAQLTWQQQQAIEKLAPTHLEVPSGSRIQLEYKNDETPILAVRLQELFGLNATPVIAGGRVKVMLHLLSPARKPVQITQDLANFWQTTYYEVRKDLRGRYPKHYWPDDPLQAEPKRGIKPRR